MKPVKTRISLDITKSGSQVSIPMFRGDTNRSLIFTLTENGKPYSLDDCDVAFTGIKADGNFLNNTCKVDYDKQIVIYNLYENDGDSDDHRQTTTTEGTVECQLVISKNDIRVASACFDIMVLKTIYNEEDILESDVALGAMKKYYVPVSRQIANISLNKDITAKQLNEALKTYPILVFNSEPDTSTQGNNGQIGIYKNTTDGSVSVYYCGGGNSGYTQWTKISADINELKESMSPAIGALIDAPTSNTGGRKKQLAVTPNESGDGYDLYICMGQNQDGTYKWLPVAKDLSEYVPTERKIADIDLSDDISVSELQTALQTYPILYFGNQPSFNTIKGKYGQLAIVTGIDPEDTTKRLKQIYICYGGNENTGYNWTNIYKSSDFVEAVRTIAGLDLKSDITKEKLRDALSTYPILTARYEATSDLKGEYGQLCLGGTADKQYKLYFCSGGTDEKGYDWTLVGGIGVMPDNAVPATRTIAGVDLSGDITADDLQEALDTYPIYTSSSLPDIEEILKVGQLALYSAYDGKTWTRDIYYRYSGGLYLIGGTTFNNNMLPDAIKKYLDETSDSFDDMHEYASCIQSVQSPTTLTLALMADTHYCDNNANAQDKLDTANKMALLSNYVHIDAVVNLGDFVAGNEPKDITKTDLAKLIANTNQNARCPVLYIRGNHDDNGWYSYEGDGTNQTGEIFNDKEWYQSVFGFTHKDVVIDENKPYGGYGYYDHTASKIRVFLLNTSDIPYIINEDGTYRYNSYQHSAFSNEQLNFVAKALKFEDKDNPNEWAAMFLMHIPLDTTKTSGYHFGGKDTIVRGTAQLLSIISAYRKGTSYSFSGAVNMDSLGELSEDFSVAIDVDYSDKGVGDVICFVNGHIHIDNCSQKVGYEGSLSYGYTYLGIIGSTSFATMVVDRENSIVTTFKYGDVTTLSDMGDRTDFEGVIDGEAEFDIDMKTGAWSIPFDQFRPTGENLYNGLSDLWGNGYALDNSATLNVETLELTNAIEGSSSISLSKGVAVKGLTQYVVPSEFINGTVVAFSETGTRVGTITPVVSEGCQIITTTASVRYLVFRFHIPSYPDYENFYIKEYVSESGESDV